MSKNNLNVDLNFEADILTPRSAAHLIISIFEALLFQRNQIPFVFRTFNYFISKWDIPDETDETLISNFNLHRQRKAAINTLKEIKKLKEAIKEIFKSKNDILSIRFLFGATPQLPKEIYHFKMPLISKLHSDEVHWPTVDPMIREILRNLLTSEMLYKIFSTRLLSTNLFLDVELKSKNENLVTDNLTLKDNIEFPPSCKEIVLNLNNKQRSKNLKLECCQNLQVFDATNNNNIGNSLLTRTETNNNHNNINWWEFNYSVKGFKDSTKSLNIWKNED